MLWLVFKIPKYDHKMLWLVVSSWWCKIRCAQFQACKCTMKLTTSQIVYVQQYIQYYIYSQYIQKQPAEIILTFFLLTLNKSVLIKFQNEHISSIMRISRQFQACLFFFYEKVLSVKIHKQISTNKRKLNKH